MFSFCAGSRRSGVLLKTNVTSVMLPTCNTTLMEYNRQADQPSLRNGLVEGQLCAYDPEAKSDACQGDSGGPIQLLNSRTGLSTVAGIVSFGISCGTALPSIYTRVARYLDWIEPIVWPDTWSIFTHTVLHKYIIWFKTIIFLTPYFFNVFFS